KCSEAERFYRQALAQGQPSVALLNNLGNHYTLCGDADQARSYFERVIKLNPQHANANLQLARIATDRHQGTRALEYLARVGDSQPAIRMLRAEAMHWAGKQAAALTMLDGLRKEAAGDQRLGFLYGLTCARIGAYDRAEAAVNAPTISTCCSTWAAPRLAPSITTAPCVLWRSPSRFSRAMWMRSWNWRKSTPRFTITPAPFIFWPMPDIWPPNVPRFPWRWRTPPRAANTTGTLPSPTTSIFGSSPPTIRR